MARNKKGKHAPSKRRDHHRIELRYQRSPAYVEARKNENRRAKYSHIDFKLWVVYSTNSVAQVFRDPTPFFDKKEALDYVKGLRRMGLEVVMHYVNPLSKREFWFDGCTAPTVKRFAKGLAAI